MVHVYRIGDLVQFRFSSYLSPSGTSILVNPFVQIGKVVDLKKTSDDQLAYTFRWNINGIGNQYADILESKVIGPWDGMNNPNHN